MFLSPFRHPTFVSLFILFLGLCLISWNIRVLRRMQTEMENGPNNRLVSKKRSDSDNTCSVSQRQNVQTEINKNRPIAWINGKSKNTGYLLHIKRIFSLLGYSIVEGLPTPSDTKFRFDMLWNHEYPFTVPEVKAKIDGLENDWRLVNHVPGSGYYTSKVSLATCNLSIGIPQAFEMPAKKKEFEEYTKLNPTVLWVQKSNAHRGIKVVDAKRLDLNKEDTFVQKFVENPLLIDGRKFDIGIYTVITSISPLRVYIYDGDILLRFCPKQYLPLDPEDVDKYVVGDDYTPVWEMPSLAVYYNKMDLSFKETFNAYLRKKLNKDPEHIYNQIRQIIREVFITQNENMRRSLKNYKNKRKFFELSRFDFVVDEELNVFLMEANMSPNLSSDHFTQNQVLYEQVLLNIFSLVGIASHLAVGNAEEKHAKQNAQVFVSDKNLMVYSEHCAHIDCQAEQCEKNKEKCGLCSWCLPEESKEILGQAYTEQLNSRRMMRLLPHFPTDKNADQGIETFARSAKITQIDQLQANWFIQMCKLDARFC